MPIKFISKTQSLIQIQTATIEECAEYCKTKKVLGVDTETEGFDFTCKKMIMLQIGDQDTQFVIDTRHINIEPLREVFESKDKVQDLKLYENRFRLDSTIISHPGVKRVEKPRRERNQQTHRRTQPDYPQHSESTKSIS